ncbi:unnamed protein product [Mytilus edulis]|uniref:Uncharacterized protein n=1 Tax=Mytilus edulis TaxID=6550 RepID=A0A8S3S6X6_MYTED|nr:unnamed protein product [Mytilus edulis]
MIETRFGKYPKGSPISYQRKLSSHFILNVLDADFPLLPIENLMVNELNPVLDQKKCTSLDSICVTAEESHNIEEITRLQSNDPKWHAIRKDRLTASVAGDIVKRRAGYTKPFSEKKTNSSAGWFNEDDDKSSFVERERRGEKMQAQEQVI